MPTVGLPEFQEKQHIRVHTDAINTHVRGDGFSIKLQVTCGLGSCGDGSIVAESNPQVR